LSRNNTCLRSIENFSKRFSISQTFESNIYNIEDFESYQTTRELKHNSLLNEEKIQMKIKEINIISLKEKDDNLFPKV